SRIRFDFAKTHLDDALIDAFLALAKARDFTGAREALFAGKPVNVTEERAAEHPAERGQGVPESVKRARQLQSRMRALIDAIEADAFRPIQQVLHIGIGGSALGPQRLVDAPGADVLRHDVAGAAKVDGAAPDAVVD